MLTRQTQSSGQSLSKRYELRYHAPMDVAELLAELIRHRTHNPGGDEPAICRMLEQALRDRGADEVLVVQVPRDEPDTGTGAYVLARWGEPRTVINAHIDTVPANSGWSVDPWAGIVTNDRVVGLGAADTKGAIAATLTALDSTKPHNLGVLFSGDEERTGTCIKHFLAGDWAKQIQHAIVCEPTGRSVGVKHRGCNAYVAEIEGRGGHSSNADHMPRPIVTMAHIAVSLDELAARWLDRGPDDMKGLCLNVASIDGGVAFNVVPNQATLTFSIRPAPGFDLQTFEEEVLQQARKANERVQMKAVLSMVPFGNRDPQRFRELLGNLAGPEVTLPFWTEAAAFSQAGIDAVVIGPGDIAQAHAPDEFVTKSDLLWAVDVFKHVIATTRAS